MGLYEPGPTESSRGGLDRPPDSPGWFENGMNNIGSGIKSFGGGVSRFISGNNDWTAPVPTISTSLTGGSRQWTEADYQNALAVYNQMTPEQQQAMGGPPPAPEVMSPGMANVNLQRGYFNPYVASLAQAAEGKGPSQAQNMLREGTATTVSSQFGAAASPSVGGAQRAALYSNAMSNAAGAQQTGARQSAQLRAQEMTDARQQLGNALNQQQITNTNAMQLGFQREKANQDAEGNINILNQKTGQENRGGAGGAIGSFFGSLSDIRAKEDIQPLGAFQSTIPQQSASSLYGMPGQSSAITPTIEPAAPTPQMQVPQKEEGGFLSKIFSDEKSKERIRELEGALDESRRTADTLAGTEVQYPKLGPDAAGPEPWDPRGVRPLLAEWPGDKPRPVAANFARFGTPGGYAELSSPQGSKAALGPVAPYEYRYKPEFAAATGEDTTPRAGIMAQDLEKSPNPALRSAVIDTPMGKAIDGKRAISANLALSAGLDKRLRNIEQGINQPVQYPSLIHSDKVSKETIRLLSDALAARPPVQTVPVATQPPLIPEDGRIITPLDDSERKLRRMMSGTVDPYGQSRAAIETASMAQQPGQLPRWSRDYSDPDYEVAGRDAPPRYY